MQKIIYDSQNKYAEEDRHSKTHLQPAQVCQHKAILTRYAVWQLFRCSFIIYRCHIDQQLRQLPCI